MFKSEKVNIKITVKMIQSFVESICVHVGLDVLLVFRKGTPRIIDRTYNNWSIDGFGYVDQIDVNTQDCYRGDELFVVYDSTDNALTVYDNAREHRNIAGSKLTPEPKVGSSVFVFQPTVPGGERCNWIETRVISVTGYMFRTKYKVKLPEGCMQYDFNMGSICVHWCHILPDHDNRTHENIYRLYK